MMPKSVTVTVSPITASFQTNVNQTSSLWRKKKKKKRNQLNTKLKLMSFTTAKQEKKISAFEWG